MPTHNLTKLVESLVAKRANIGFNTLMASSNWSNLVVETQFATELTMNGIRRLCTVPAHGSPMPWGHKDLNFALHVGMYSYASGLERLCKLTIACSKYATEGEFPKLKSYNHKIGALLDAVEELPRPTSPIAPRRAKWVVRPVDELDPDLTKMVERFANGAGRYEHLDALWDSGAEVSTYDDWSALASKAEVSPEVKRLISLKRGVTDVIGSEMIELELEATSSNIMADLELPLYEPSVAVALSLFRKVRWVATILDAATNYTSENLPILGEVVGPTFVHSSENFFNYHIARFSDDMVVEEELEVAYERIHAREIDPE